MSLSRHFLREFRPLFRMLEEPFGRPLPTSLTRHSPFTSAFFNDPFFSGTGTSLNGGLNVPAIDLSEQASEYVVEAELPGVKKENVEIRIGDGGQSLTIEGRTFARSVTGPDGGERQALPAAAVEGQELKTQEVEKQATSAATAEGISNGASAAESAVLSALPSDHNQVVAEATSNQNNAAQLSSERSFSSSFSFSRTVWLPRRVDGSNVKAKLEDGILTVRIPKAEDPESVRVSID